MFWHNFMIGKETLHFFFMHFKCHISYMKVGFPSIQLLPLPNFLIPSACKLNIYRNIQCKNQQICRNSLIQNRVSITTKQWQKWEYETMKWKEETGTRLKQTRENTCKTNSLLLLQFPSSQSQGTWSLSSLSQLLMWWYTQCSTECSQQQSILQLISSSDGTLSISSISWNLDKMLHELHICMDLYCDGWRRGERVSAENLTILCALACKIGVRCNVFDCTDAVQYCVVTHYCP